MKKALWALVLFLGMIVLAAPALAVDRPDGKSGWYTTIDSAAVIAASGSYTTASYDVHYAAGFFSLQYGHTGSGTATVSYLVSNDNSTFTTPLGGGTIFTGILAADGTVSTEFAPDFCNYIKFVIAETGGVSEITTWTLVPGIR